MVLKIRNREVSTEEDNVNAALQSEGVSDMQDLSLEEKRQILQAIENSKEETQQKEKFLEETRNVPDVSSTTIEDKNETSIIVQVGRPKKGSHKLDDSNDDLIVFNIEDGAENHCGTPETKTLDSSDEKQASPINASRCLFQMINDSDPKLHAIHNRLMDINVLDHPCEKQEISFYQERLNAIKQKRCNHSSRTAWHFSKEFGLTREEHFNIVAKEMDSLDAKYILQHLQGCAPVDSFGFRNVEQSISEKLPYGLTPKEIPYSRILDKEENSQGELAKSTPWTKCNPTKIAIKPRIVESDDRVEDHCKPGPSSRGNFSPVQAMEDRACRETESVEYKRIKTESDKSSDLVDCPLCSSYFPKSSIQEHFDLCEQSRNTELVDGCCPFCLIALPIESLRVMHMTKCLTKHKSGKLAAPLGLKRPADHDNEIISESDESDNGEEPPVKKVFTPNTFK